MSEKEITTGEDGRLYIEHGGKLYKMPEGSRAGYVYCDIQQDTGTAQSDPPKRPAIHIEQAQEDDGTRVTIADCLIAMDGFEPLTKAVKELTTQVSLIGLQVAILALVITIAVWWR